MASTIFIPMCVDQQRGDGSARKAAAKRPLGLPPLIGREGWSNSLRMPKESLDVRPRAVLRKTMLPAVRFQSLSGLGAAAIQVRRSGRCLPRVRPGRGTLANCRLMRCRTRARATAWLRRSPINQQCLWLPLCPCHAWRPRQTGQDFHEGIRAAVWCRGQGVSERLLSVGL